MHCASDISNKMSCPFSSLWHVQALRHGHHNQTGPLSYVDAPACSLDEPRCPIAHALLEAELSRGHQDSELQAHVMVSRSSTSSDISLDQSSSSSATSSAHSSTSDLVRFHDDSIRAAFQQQTPSLWSMARPVLDNCPKLKRRELRRMNRSWTLAEVAQHCYRDDAWIALDGKVYDITEHLVHHHGWDGAGISTVISILAHAGTECSTEFHQIHRSFPIAYKQLAAYYIGDLSPEP